MLYFDYTDDLGLHYQRAVVGIDCVVEQFAALDCVADERERSDLKAKITREIEQTDRALTRAIWESAADFSEGQHSQHPTMLRRTEYRVLRESAIDRFKLTVSDVYRC